MAPLLKRNFVSTVAAGALTVAGAFGMAGVANAQDNSVMAAPTQQGASMHQGVNVPTRNVRGVNEEYLRVLAAEVSLDSVVLIVYGHNRELYDQVKKAAIDVTAEGYAVRGILVTNGPEAVEIYADAQRYGVHDSPSAINTEGFLAQTRGVIRDAYAEIILPRREEARRVAIAENEPVASR